MCRGRGDYRVLLHFRTTNLILLPFHIFADYISCISKAYVVYVEQQPTSSETSWIRIPFAPIFGGPPTKSPGDTACQVGKGPIDNGSPCWLTHNQMDNNWRGCLCTEPPAGHVHSPGYSRHHSQCGYLLFQRQELWILHLYNHSSHHPLLTTPSSSIACIFTFLISFSWKNMINKSEQFGFSHSAARSSFHTFINGTRMEYTMKCPILQISEVVKCQADKDKLQEKENSQSSVSE